MSKEKKTFVCSDCGATSPKWLGQCPGCSAWNTLNEHTQASEAATKHRYAALAGASPLTPLNRVQAADIERTSTGITEFDRVLGGGIVPGSVVLLGGEPGVGKSTLLLQAMEGLRLQGRKTIYISGEESLEQSALRARRLGLGDSPLMFQAEIQLERILATMDAERPDVAVIDSIQTTWSEQLTAAPGSVSQVRECAAQITRAAKAHGIAVILVGHINKDQSLNGPKQLEHLVDTVIVFESDLQSNFRVTRATKNRFGSVNELGCFYMSETGLKSVPNPSAMFLTSHAQPVPGSCVMATIDGTRPILCEIQALVDEGGPSPRRLSIGLERDRLAMQLAVLNRHGSIQTLNQDVFVNAVGGLRITEPAADLATILAIQSSVRNKALPQGLLVFGEVGLAGEIRPAPKGMDRLQEAVKLGFNCAIISKLNAPKKPIPGMVIHTVERVDQALQVVRNLP
jgi:DNA repair protein RadA/Sms